MLANFRYRERKLGLLVTPLPIAPPRSAVPSNSQQMSISISVKLFALLFCLFLISLTIPNFFRVEINLWYTSKTRFATVILKPIIPMPAVHQDGMFNIQCKG